MITKETRKESLNATDKTKRYAEIKEVLSREKDGLTAREIANRLGSNERNYTAPRCTELVDMGQLEVIGKRYDAITNRNVAVYKLKSQKIDVGILMRCENCEHGYLKKENGKLKEIYCRKTNANMSISYYKKLRTCNLFERRNLYV